MRAADANAWPVADGGKLVGAIDHADPDRQVGRHGHDPRVTRVGDTMKHDAVFCYEDQDSAEAERKMAEHGLNHVPVVDREMRIVGIVSRADVGESGSVDHVEGSAPSADWKPGELHSVPSESAGKIPRGNAGDDSSPRDKKPEGEGEWFPFRAAVDPAETR